MRECSWRKVVVVVSEHVSVVEDESRGGELQHHASTRVMIQKNVAMF